MLRKTLLALAALALLVIAAALVAPYFVGARAEAAFRADVGAFNARSPSMRLTVTNYRRGFYSSEATLEVAAAPGAGPEQARLLQLVLGAGGTPRIDVRINHGPIAIGAFTTHFSLIPVLYTADFSASNLPPLSVLGALKPELYDEAWLGGGHLLTVDVPPGRVGFGVFGAQWRGGQAVVATDAARDRVHYSGRMEQVKFEAMDPQSGVTVHGTLRPLSWRGRSRRGEHGLWGGRGEMRGGGLAVTSGGQSLVEADAGRGATQSGETSDGRWYHWHAEAVQDGGSARGWKWSRLEIRAAMDRLDAAGLAQALKRLRAGDHRGPAGARAALVQGMLAAAGPQTTGRLHLRLVAGAGTLEADGALDFAATAPAPAGAAAPLARARARLRVAFPRALVLDFAAKVLGPDARTRAGAELANLHRLGYLALGSNGRYRAVLVWRAQGVTVNGLPVGAAHPAPAAATGAGL